MKHIFFIFIITSLCICKTNNSTAQVNVNDSLALVDLYNSTDGAHWTSHTNWLSGVVSTWQGIKVIGGRVTQIDLHFNNVKGTLPPSFGNLTELTLIWMTDNYLTGSLPASFSNLTKLTAIYLFNNQLTGSLAALENCTNPGDFELSYNKFSGTLPNFQHIDKMTFIDLDNNQLTGNIPESYGSFTGDQITLDHNKLTGGIPESLGNLASTTLIFLNDNQLTGPVPISFLNLPYYADLALENNHLTFDGIQDIVAAHPPFYFTYAPQLNIPITYTPQGTYGKLSVHSGGTLSNNTYLWYRNNSLYKTIVGDSAFIVDSPGVYFAKVNNAVVTALQLSSDSITIAAACSVPPSNTAATNIKQTTARLNWNTAQGAVKYQIKFSATGGAVSTINTANPYYKLNGLTPNTNYTWKVRSRCSLQYSAYAAATSFTTLPAFTATSQSEDEINKENSFTISPNPASANVNVMFNSTKQSAYRISVYDIAGKMLLSKTGSANASINNFMLDVHALSAGIYLIKIHYDTDKTIMQKLVKQ